MSDDGYQKYEKFFKRPPLLTLEWHDDESDAVGWLAINSLRGGAAGGGTRMRANATKEESIFLAKTMEIKFRISGPPIGGAKSVIRVTFDPHADEKQKTEVLSRWYKSIEIFLRQCYGTGGDLNVSERETKRLTKELGLSHPQEGIVRGHFNPPKAEYGEILRQLNVGVEMSMPSPDLPRSPKPLTVAHMITGYGLARSLRHFYDLRSERLEGKRVLIEGFGAVGGSGAYYLAREGAKVVGVMSLANEPGDGGEQRSWAIDDDGLDVNALLWRREKNNLPSDCRTGSKEEAAEAFWKTEADIFVPAAASYTVDSSIIRGLKGAGVSVIACGSNVPFSFEAEDSTDEGVKEIKDISEITDIGKMAEHALVTQREADTEFAIIPDFIANCGMARVFAYLMGSGVRVNVDAIFEDTDKTIRGVMGELLTDHDGGGGLLKHAYSLYIPEVR